MQIQPSDNILNASSVKPVQETAEPRSAASEAVAAELGRAFADVVQKALQSCLEDAGAVHDARRAMAQDRLETPEAFETAAENILLFGI